MPVLPMSVLVKADAYSDSGVAAHAWTLLRDNLRADFQRPDQWSTVLLTIFFLFLTTSARKKLHRAVYAGVSLLGVSQLTVGRFGWFHRYEDYAVIFFGARCPFRGHRVIPSTHSRRNGHYTLLVGVLHPRDSNDACVFSCDSFSSNTKCTASSPSTTPGTTR